MIEITDKMAIALFKEIDCLSMNELENKLVEKFMLMIDEDY